MKKHFVRLFAVLLVLALTACSGAGSSSSAVPASSAAPAASSAAPASSAASSAAPAEKIELLWWQTNSGTAEYFQPVCERTIETFNNTNDKNIHVTIEHIGDNNYQELLTAVAAGTAPDAAVGFSPQPMQYGLIGEGLDLTPIMDEWKAEGNAIVEDIQQDYWDFYTSPDGVLYGIPYRFDPRVISYRKDYFEEAGITEMPTTWDEFIEVCRTLKKTFPDKIPFGIAGNSFMAIHAVIGFGANNNVGWVDENLKPTMTSQPWIEMLEFFGTLRQEELISAGSAAYISADLQKLFAANEVCMVYQGSPAFVLGTENEDKVSVMPPLQGPSGTKQQTYAWITGAHGLAQTDHPDETRAFLKWWSENTLDHFTEGRSNSLPIRTSHQNNPEVANNWVRQETIAAVQVGCVTNAFPVPGLYLEFSQIEGEGIPGNALREVMEGATNYQELAEKYQKDLEAVFA